VQTANVLCCEVQKITAGGFFLLCACDLAANKKNLKELFFTRHDTTHFACQIPKVFRALEAP
jgi:hypothetical protein